VEVFVDSTKTCPNCGTIAPVSARRCKECFHDYSAKETRQPLVRTLLPMLGATALMSVLGALTISWMTSFPTNERALVDATSKQIQWIREFKDGHFETDQVAFDRVKKIQYHADGANFTVVAVLDNGETRDIIRTMGAPIQSQAEDYAKLMDKPFEIVDARASKAE
jgi:hypothetical protein